MKAESIQRQTDLLLAHRSDDALDTGKRNARTIKRKHGDVIPYFEPVNSKKHKLPGNDYCHEVDKSSLVARAIALSNREPDDHKSTGQQHSEPDCINGLIIKIRKNQSKSGMKTRAITCQLRCTYRRAIGMRTSLYPYKKPHISDTKLCDLFSVMIDIHQKSYNYLNQANKSPAATTIKRIYRAIEGELTTFISTLCVHKNRENLVSVFISVFLKQPIHKEDTKKLAFDLLESILSRHSSPYSEFYNRLDITVIKQELDGIDNRNKVDLYRLIKHKCYYKLGLIFIKNSEFELAEASLTKAFEFIQYIDTDRCIGCLAYIKKDCTETEIDTLSSQLTPIKTSGNDWLNANNESTTPPRWAGYEVSSLSSSPQASGNMTQRDLEIAETWIRSARALSIRCNQTLRVIPDHKDATHGLYRLCQQGYFYEIFRRLDKGFQIICNFVGNNKNRIGSEDFIKLSYLFESISHTINSIPADINKNMFLKKLSKCADDLICWNKNTILK